MKGKKGKKEKKDKDKEKKEETPEEKAKREAKELEAQAKGREEKTHCSVQQGIPELFFVEFESLIM